MYLRCLLVPTAPGIDATRRLDAACASGGACTRTIGVAFMAPDPGYVMASMAGMSAWPVWPASCRWTARPSRPSSGACARPRPKAKRRWKPGADARACRWSNKAARPGCHLRDLDGAVGRGRAAPDAGRASERLDHRSTDPIQRAHSPGGRSTRPVLVRTTDADGWRGSPVRPPRPRRDRLERQSRSGTPDRAIHHAAARGRPRHGRACSDGTLRGDAGRGPVRLPALARHRGRGRHPAGRGWELGRRGHLGRGRAPERLHAGDGAYTHSRVREFLLGGVHPACGRARAHPGTHGPTDVSALAGRSCWGCPVARPWRAPPSTPRVVAVHARRRRAAIQAASLVGLAEPLQGPASQQILRNADGARFAARRACLSHQAIGPRSRLRWRRAYHDRGENQEGCT